jgi:hypothetical protein
MQQPLRECTELAQVKIVATPIAIAIRGHNATYVPLICWLYDKTINQ